MSDIDFDRTGERVASDIEFDKVRVREALPIVAQNFPPIIPPFSGGVVQSSGSPFSFPLQASLGGTGFGTYVIGDILYANSTSTLARRPIGTNGFVLTVDAGLPVWAAPSGLGLIGGSGTANKIPKFATSLTLTDSVMTEVGSKIGFNAAAPFYLQDINGEIRLQSANKLWFGGTVGVGDSSIHLESAGRLRASGQFVVSNSTIPASINSSVLLAAGRASAGQSAFIGVFGTVEAGFKIFDDAGQERIKISGTMGTGAGDELLIFDVIGVQILTATWERINVNVPVNMVSYVESDLRVETLKPGDWASSVRNLSPTGFGGRFIVPGNQVALEVSNETTGFGVHQFYGNGNANLSVGGGALAIGGSVQITGNVTGNAGTLTIANNVAITGGGSITSGIWAGSAIGPTVGGTGQTSYATGDILYASGVNTLAKLGAGTNGYVLTMTAGVPAWAAGGGTVGGSGTINKIPKFSGATTLTDSIITESGGAITVSSHVTITGFVVPYYMSLGIPGTTAILTVDCGDGTPFDGFTFYSRFNMSSIARPFLFSDGSFVTCAILGGQRTASSGVETPFMVMPRFTQSGTAGYTALYVNARENTTGSGTKKLLDLAVNGSSKASVSNLGALSALQGSFIDNTAAGNALYAKQSSATGYGLILIPGADATYEALRIRDAADSATRHSFFGSGDVHLCQGAGNVGIGVTPGAKFQVETPASGVGVVFRTTTGTNNPGLFISTVESTGITDLNASGSSNFKLSLSTGGTERLRVDGANFGFGGVSFGSGDGVIFLANATTAPTTNPTGGALLYTSAGIPYFRSSAGDVIKLFKSSGYTPTNVSADRSYDANATTLDELADVLGTLIADLQLTGLIG